MRLMLHTVIGTLKGFDQLMNLVLDEVKEITKGAQNSIEQDALSFGVIRPPWSPSRLN